MAARAAREIFLTLGLVASGLIALPALVYLVGQQLIGEYADGLTGLYAALSEALTAGNPYAWLLVLSPWLCFQLLRLLLVLRPRRRA